MKFEIFQSDDHVRLLIDSHSIIMDFSELDLLATKLAELSAQMQWRERVQKNGGVEPSFQYDGDWEDVRYRYVCPDCKGSGIYGFKPDSYAADRELQVQEPAF